MRRRGTVYLIVLVTVLVVTLMAVTGLMVGRAQTEAARSARDTVAARANARTAVELGMAAIVGDSSWRTNHGSGVWFQDVSLGSGTCSLEVVDLDDGDLTDDLDEPVTLIGTGAVGGAMQKIGVTIVPDEPTTVAMDVLNMAVHADGQLQVNWSDTLTVSGGPASSGTRIVNFGTIAGDAEAPEWAGIGLYTGSKTTVPPKDMPPTSVIDVYATRGTSIPDTSVIENVVLSSGSNPYGLPDPNGVYVLNTGGDDVEIRNCRIYGTLIIRTAGGTVRLNDEVLIHPTSSDKPSLLIDGHLELSFDYGSNTLRETVLGINLNPTGSPYEGVADKDTTDRYPSIVRGLVYVTGNVSVSDAGRLQGCLVAGGSIQIARSFTFEHDPDLLVTPPEGFTQQLEPDMIVEAGTWRRIVD